MSARTHLEGWRDILDDLARQIAGSPLTNDTRPVAIALLHVAGALQRIADSMEKPVIKVDKGAVHFGIANFEDQPDSQTAQIREIASKRERDSGEA